MKSNAILYCIPYAGGSAKSLSNVTFRLKEIVDIHILELPGRGERRYEPLNTNLNSIIDEFYQKIVHNSGNSQQKIILWGHSMGAVIAFLLAEKLTKSGFDNFSGLIVSSMTSPLSNSRSERKLHLLPEDEFLQYFEKLVPSVKADSRMRDILYERMKHIVRADIEALENVKVENWNLLKIDSPIYVMYSLEDEIMTNGKDFESWSLNTNSYSKYYKIKGGHFFILDHSRVTAEVLTEIIYEAVDYKTEDLVNKSII